MAPSEIKRRYPMGLREIRDPGPHGLAPGQITDDGEMALTLGRALRAAGGYDPDRTLRAYRAWLASGPPDHGNATAQALRPGGDPNPETQANGALMRAGPLALAFWTDPVLAALRAAEDAALTHPNPVPVAANQIFVWSLAQLILGNRPPALGYVQLHITQPGWRPVVEVLDAAQAGRPPRDYLSQQGWVLVALGNAFYQLGRLFRGEVDFESALIDTVEQGGDADTNGAVAGALLGAAAGLEAIPARWIGSVLGRDGNRGWRPVDYLPDDALELADELLQLGERIRAGSPRP